VAPDRSTGRVTKVANLGRAGETVDDLDHPTATFSYTFATFADDTWTPASAHTTTRRVHWMGSETTDFDEAWVYFDGSGRELLSKAKAAPHPSTPSTPRFVGSGRVLLDAKGNPIKQYEPYFSATLRSPLIVIALSRPSRSLAPNGHPLPILLNPRLTAAGLTPPRAPAPTGFGKHPPPASAATPTPAIRGACAPPYPTNNLA
jgi:hypothetical protein